MKRQDILMSWMWGQVFRLVGGVVVVVVVVLSLMLFGQV
jgi:hypothetical protein